MLELKCTATIATSRRPEKSPSVHHRGDCIYAQPRLNRGNSSRINRLCSLEIWKQITRKKRGNRGCDLMPSLHGADLYAEVEASTKAL